MTEEIYGDAIATFDDLAEPFPGDDSMGGYVEASPEPMGWTMVHLDAIVDGLLDGTLEFPRPDICRLSYRYDSESERPVGLFYRGHVNSIHGSSNSAKTWLAMIAMAQEIEGGEHVFYIDAEDNERTAVLRLLQMGTDPQAIKARFHYIHPDGAYTAMDRERVMNTGEALGLEGIDANADGEVAQWFTSLPRPLANLGACVLLLDHVTKAQGDTAGAWDVVDPSGSARKRNAPSGAMYYVHAIQPFERGVGGASSIVCTKDRHGTFHRGKRVGVMVADADPRMRGTGLNLQARPWDDMDDAERAVHDPKGAADGSDRRNRILIALPGPDSPGLGRNELAAATGIAPADVGKTLRELERDGLARNHGTSKKADWRLANTA
jgi:hypothetical protein